MLNRGGSGGIAGFSSAATSTSSLSRSTRGGGGVHMGRLLEEASARGHDLTRGPLITASLLGQFAGEIERRGWTPRRFLTTLPENLDSALEHTATQEASFKVDFEGEVGQDYGGPYVEFLSVSVGEVPSYPSIGLVHSSPNTQTLGVDLVFPSNVSMLDSVTPPPPPPANAPRTFSHFLTAPCTVTPAARGGVGGIRGLATQKQPSSPMLNTLPPPELSILSAYRFWGSLAGLAIRHNIVLALDFSPTVWRPLVGLPIRVKDIMAVDSRLGEALGSLEGLKEMVAGEGVEEGGGGEEGSSLTLTSPLSLLREFAGRVVSLLGEAAPPHATLAASHVTFSTRPQFLQYIKEAAVKSGNAAAYATAFYSGLTTVLPTELFLLWSPRELARVLTGEATVTVPALQRMTVLDVSKPPSATQVQWLWETLGGWDNATRVLFLHFVTARKRIPASPLTITLNTVTKDERGGKGTRYFVASTCHLVLTLGLFATREEFGERLLEAIKQPAFFSKA